MGPITTVDDQLAYRVAALGTTAELVVTDRHALIAASRMLEGELDQLDRVASRFRTDSELADIDRAQGAPVAISTALLEMMLVALRVARATDGTVDPTVGGALNRLGYDRDFAAVVSGIDGQLPAPTAVPGWRSIDVDQATSTIRVPAGTRIDLGATAKSWAADRIAARIFDRLGCGVVVSLGGDVSVAGQTPRGGFRVGLGDAVGAGPSGGTVAIESGGLATSGISVRRWRLGKGMVHHIVDPSTGLPTQPWWRTVTVVAASCVDANAASTAAIVKGPSAVPWLQYRRLPARLVAVDGTITRLNGWPDPDRASVRPSRGRS
jgi:thiamine biosynthesis lipoprotein ApbE